MSIVIDKNKCVGCKNCMDVCPGSLLKLGTDGKAYIKYPKDCWGCCSCIKECRLDAIALYLGADIGGMGSRMTVRQREHFLDWNIEKTDGTVKTIVIDKKESNKY
ncbi:MAG: ferredoxin family protein [Lachnospira sp.]